MRIRHILVIATTSMGALAGCASTDRSPEYGIREDTPKIGSMIRRFVTEPVSIPVNRPYDQFSAADKAAFNQYYESVDAGSEPPFPAEGMKAVLEPIAKAQARLLVRGDLFLVAKISPTGEATEVKAIGSPSAAMTTFASQVLMLTKFKPAVCGGVPCSMEFPLYMHFKLN